MSLQEQNEALDDKERVDWFEANPDIVRRSIHVTPKGWEWQWMIFPKKGNENKIQWAVTWRDAVDMARRISGKSN
jgi:hypothetical protein